MSNFRKLYFFVLLLTFASFTISAKTVFPSLFPLFEFEAEEENLSAKEIISAALKFSLCPEDTDDHSYCMEIFEELLNNLTTEDFLSLTEEEKGEAILSLMYDKVLVRYVEHQTKLDTLFKNGSYNCVSSSVLYLALAKAAGLSLVPQKTPDHAFCTIVLSDGKRIDVETTNPYGFKPGTKKQVESKGNSTRYAITPAKKYRGRSDVSERILVSLVGGNLAVQFMEKGDYANAVPLQATRILFTEDEKTKASEEVRMDFEKTCSNYAADLQKQNKFLGAVLWFEEVMSAWGNSNFIQPKYDLACYNYIATLTNSGEYDKAYDFIDARRDKINFDTLKESEKNIVMMRLQEKIKTLDEESALELLKETLSLDVISSDKTALARIRSWQEYCWSKKITSCMKTEGYIKAAALADEAINEIGESQSIAKLKADLLYNHAVGVHNRYASLVNKKLYKEAESVLKEGLSENPTSKVLQSDLRQLKKYLENKN